MDKILISEFIRALEAEAPASRKCLERITPEFFDYKPHEKSMVMKYLAIIVADIPKWISEAVKHGEVDLGTWEKLDPKNSEDLVNYLDKNMKNVKDVLSKSSDADLEGKFELKMNGHLLYSTTKSEMISSSIRHWTHHRGQLTVYMRLNNIPVPSLYGPTADEKGF